MVTELFSEWPWIQNWIFIVFLFCFMIDARVLGVRRKLVITMLYNLFHNDTRESIFTESVHNEFISKLFLCLQTSLLFSVFIYGVCLHEGVWVFNTLASMSILLGLLALVLLLFILVKFILNYVLGNIFFGEEKVRRWNDAFFSVLSLSGLVLFFPVLLLFFIEEAYYICYYIVLLYFIFLLFLTIYKIYEIFFHGKGISHYFILYLCTLEILPLFLVSKGFICFIEYLQEGTLWFQI